MAQQTAVEWLQYLYENRPESDLLEQDFEQAKAMEKNQMEVAWNKGYKSCKEDIVSDKMTTFDQYIQK